MCLKSSAKKKSELLPCCIKKCNPMWVSVTNFWNRKAGMLVLGYYNQVGFFFFLSVFCLFVISSKQCTPWYFQLRKSQFLKKNTLSGTDKMKRKWRWEWKWDQNGKQHEFCGMAWIIALHGSLVDGKTTWWEILPAGDFFF